MKEKLKSRIFLGTFKEKSFVPEINDYRNVIILSPAETELSMDLVEFRRRINKFYKNPPCWFGFSTGDKSVVETTGTLYVDDLDDIPFGHFWFQIRTVRFKPEEVKLKLRVLRQVIDADFNSSKMSSVSNTTTDITRSSLNQSTSSAFTTESIDWSEIFTTWADSTSQNVKEFLYYKVNRENLKKAFHLMTLFTIALTVGAIEFVKYVGNFSIRLMTEFSRLLHVCTPLFLGVLELFSRIIGGLFIFLTMLWKDSIGGKRGPYPGAIRAIQYQPTYKNQQRTFRAKVQ